MCDRTFLLEPQLKQTGCPRDPFPVSLDVTIAPVNTVKAPARQKAGSQHPEGFDKTERVFIPNYDRAPGFQVVHKGKICMKYLSLSKKKKKIPQMLGHCPFFQVIYRNFSKTGWGIVSEKGKTFQTASFQKPSEPCGGGGQIFCWSPSGINSGRTRSARKGQIWSFVRFFPARLQQEGPAGHPWSLQLPWSGVCPVLRHPWFGSQPSVPERERSCSLSQSYSPPNKALQEREGIISFLKGQLNPL